MLKHNLLLAYRNIKRFRSTFFINLCGLAAGLACVLLIFLWVNDELGVDKFHENDSRLYQIMLRNETANGIEVGREMPPMLAETLGAEFPEVEYAVSEAVNTSGNAIGTGDKELKASGIYATQDYFKAFSYDLIQGNKAQVLAEEKNILISEDLALKLFNTTDNLVGKPIEFEYQEQYIISGIYRIPYGSSKTFDFVLPHRVVFKHFPNVKNDWSSSFMFHTYVVLQEGTSVAEFSDKIRNIVKDRSHQENISLFAAPYSGLYLHGRYENGLQAGGRIEYVKLFSIIAVFILLIACINFMNLSTAKASRRSREVGVQKAMGAGRKTLIVQYLSESLLMALLSLLLSVLLVLALLPAFNELTGKSLSLELNLSFIGMLLGLTVLTGLLAGSYPALYLSGFKPAIVLKGKFTSSASELWARKGLVIFQFTLSVILIVAVLVVYKQIEFIQTKKLGYQKDNILYFEIEEPVQSQLKPFLSGVKNIPGVQNASSIFKTFIGDLNSTSDLSWQGKSPDMNVQMQYRRVNYEMIELLGIDMKEGRAFSKDFGAEESKIIFNEAAVEVMGIEDPIGKQVKLWGRDFEIVGLTRDFHFESLHENVKPVFFFLAPERTNTIMVKVETERLPETIAGLQEYYRDFTRGLPLEYHFLDEVVQAQYVAEERVSILSRYFAGIAILISCLGLYGLVAFAAEQRRKEIGIRKVLGASVVNIVELLSKDFIRLVFISIITGSVLAWLAMSQWLAGFAYRIELSWWVFALAGSVALLIALGTVSYQALKAATANPVKNLRTE